MSQDGNVAVKSRPAVPPDEDELLERIVTRPGVLGGKPIIRGLRISVEIILGLLAAGWTEEQLLESYPDIELNDILACLAYAHRAVDREHYATGESPAHAALSRR